MTNAIANDELILERLTLAQQAVQQVQGWAGGAQALALLHAVQQAGWVDFLTETRQFTSLVGFSGLPASRVEDILSALSAHGITQCDGTTVRLTPSFHALCTGDHTVELKHVLAQAEYMTRVVSNTVLGEDRTGSAEQDALTVADSFGGHTTPVMQSLFRRFLSHVPEFSGLLEKGARFLDVGCGVSAAMLTVATLYPQVRAVGLEVVPAVAAEAGRRAQALGVADRVDIRCADARDFDEAGAFDVAFWAQPFFPSETRAGTLRAIYQALRPGGTLLMQERFTTPIREEQVRAFALTRLVHRSWGVPFARTAEELVAEASEGGFQLVRVADTPMGRMVVMDRP